MAVAQLSASLSITVVCGTCKKLIKSEQALPKQGFFLHNERLYFSKNGCEATQYKQKREQNAGNLERRLSAAA